MLANRCSGLFDFLLLLCRPMNACLLQFAFDASNVPVCVDFPLSAWTVSG